MSKKHDWAPQHLALKEYGIDGPALESERVRIRLVIQVNGKTEVDMTNQHLEFEPGIIAFISKPGESRINVVKVVPAREGAIIDGQGEPTPAPAWAIEALGMNEG